MPPILVTANRIRAVAGSAAAVNASCCCGDGGGGGGPCDPLEPPCYSACGDCGTAGFGGPPGPPQVFCSPGPAPLCECCCLAPGETATIRRQVVIESFTRTPQLREVLQRINCNGRVICAVVGYIIGETATLSREICEDEAVIRRPVESTGCEWEVQSYIRRSGFVFNRRWTIVSDCDSPTGVRVDLTRNDGDTTTTTTAGSATISLDPRSVYGLCDTGGADDGFQSVAFEATCNSLDSVCIRRNTVTIDFPPFDGGGNLCGVDFDGATDETRTEVRVTRSFRLSRNGTCSGAVRTDIVACPYGGTQAYVARRCDDPTDTIAICRSTVDLFTNDQSLPWVALRNGCCYAIDFMQIVNEPTVTLALFEPFGCESCGTSGYALESCVTGEINNDFAVNKAAWNRLPDDRTVLRLEDGTCWLVRRDLPAPETASVGDIWLPLKDCDQCGLPSGARYFVTERCDGSDAGPVVRTIDDSIQFPVFGINGECYRALGLVDPQESVTPDTVNETCDECSGDGLFYADRRCVGPNCLQPIDQYAPPRITFRERDRPPGDSVLYLGGVCNGFSICYDATNEEAPSPIVPSSPARVAWSSQVTCSNTNETPACCQSCPCPGCGPVAFENGRPFDLPSPGDLSNFATDGGLGRFL